MFLSAFSPELLEALVGDALIYTPLSEEPSCFSQESPQLSDRCAYNIKGGGDTYLARSADSVLVITG